MLLDFIKDETIYHVALIKQRVIKFGSPSNSKPEIYLANLLKKYGSFREVYSNVLESSIPENDVIKVDGIDKLISTLENLPFSYNVSITVDPNFPQSLKQQIGSTPVVYYRGDPSLFSKKSMAVIGTRKDYDNSDVLAGINVVQRLVNKEYVVVSGLAEGCDTIGHEKAIEFGGRTIAILGTPLNEYFPKSNQLLQDKIAQDHLLVSQYPIGTPFLGKFWPGLKFAHRNLTTTSLSTEGVVVIAAGDKSGTRHSIHQAAEQKKSIYVLANNFLPQRNNSWVNDLILSQYIKRVDLK